MENGIEEFANAIKKLQEEKATDTPATPLVEETSTGTPATPPVVPPVSEVPPVTPSVENPNPNEPPPDSPKNLLDLLTPPTPVATPVEAPKIPELSEDVKARIKLADEYENLIKEAKEGNVMAMAFLAGAKPEEIVQVAKSLIPEDLSHLTYEQLIKRDFEKSGLTGEHLDSAIKDTMTEYADMPDWKKVKLENEMKERFKPATTANPYLEKYQQQLIAAQQPTGPTPEQIQQTKQADIAAISAVIETLDGAEAFGFKFDKNTIGKQILDSYDERKIMPYIKPDNTLDAQSLVMDSLGKEWKTIAQAAYEQGRLDEKKGNAMPNSARKNGAAPTNITNPPSKIEAIAAFLNDPANVNKKS